MATITPLDASFGAVVTDVKIANMNATEWQAVEDAFHQYAALVFPGQHPSEDDQIAFGQRFGNIELLRPDPTKKAVPITNLKEDGTPYTKEEFRFKTLRGNEGWHTDSSYMPLAAKASILAAIQVPSKGGETALSDMRSAYDKLDEVTKGKIDGLSAYHSLYQSQAKNGFTFKTGDGYGYHTKGAPLRPLVKTHPVTGRKSLFIGRHAYEIPGMSIKDGQALLDDLLEFAVRPPRVYAHQWQPGDVMMWDNRCILHRACPYDHSEIRIMRHVRVAGEVESELVETGRDNLAEDFQPSASNR